MAQLYVVRDYNAEGYIVGDTPGVSGEIQKLEPSAIIELFEMDTTVFGGDVVRFHAGTNALRQNIVWQGDTYTAFPLQAAGFDYSGNGQLPRPKLTVANVGGAITALVLNYDDLLGAKITRKRTLAKYLDAVNFPGGTNPTADPAAEFSDDIFYIDRKVNENKNVVEFELAAAFDVAGVQLPRRQIVQNVCVWRYRGTECGYAGGNYFDANDDPVGSLALDVCGKRLSSCKARFGANNPLPFGSFPAAGLTK
jgi:lambda family phage minor tail protein L